MPTATAESPAHKRPVCVVVGVGPGNGAALARRFAAEGYAVALLARSGGPLRALAAELSGSAAVECDVADAGSVKSAFARVRELLGDPEVVVYNAGSGSWGNVEDVPPEAFEGAWRINALGPLLVSKEVVPAMKSAGRGAFVFIGATASRRGGANTAAFASAKAAQRSLAESMARHLWPAGIHVALVILDGVVDLPRTREMMKDKPDEFFVKPADVADTVVHLTRQKASAWSFEVEARPFGEKW
jgi:NAD(P)-dependent dehydrogenase (short-subunit alcohol dehydrogenase family)